MCPGLRIPSTTLHYSLRTTFSEPLFQVASRRVFQVAGVTLLLSGIIGKFGAVLTLIPDPIIGGTLTVVFGMVGAVGISVLQFMDMSSTRNLTILALSMILGLMVPQWLLTHPNSINTGKVWSDYTWSLLKSSNNAKILMQLPFLI